MKPFLKSKTAMIIVQSVIAIIAIVPMAMLANHITSWNAWDLLGAAVIAISLLVFCVLTAQA